MTIQLFMVFLNKNIDIAFCIADFIFQLLTDLIHFINNQQNIKLKKRKKLTGCNFCINIGMLKKEITVIHKQMIYSYLQKHVKITTQLQKKTEKNAFPQYVDKFFSFFEDLVSILLFGNRCLCISDYILIRVLKANI